MPTKLKVLILEDSAADTELALHELRRAGYEPDWKRVEAEPDFVAQLDQAWDVILVDYNLPEYDGQRALEITRERGLDIPLIIVSGTIGEEKAVATMKAGANDYIMKDRLSRLGPAVERELGDASERRERKRAEEALRASEERFRQLSELLPQIVFETDIKGTLTFANQFGLKSFGYSREDFRSGINIIALVAPEDRETIKSRLKEILSGSETGPREFQVVNKDGRKFPILMHANAIIKDAVPIGVRGIAIDITERKRAEEALRESEAGYRVLFEETKQGILVADAQTQRFKYANQSMSRMLGYTTEELLKLGVADIHPKESLPRVQSEFEAQIQKEKTLVTDLPCLCKDGTVIHADINSSPIIIEGRQRNVAFFTDVTERKRAEEALHESEEKYRALVENASEAILIAQDGRLKFVNHMASEISGYSDLELRSSPFLEFVHPEDRDMVGERYLERFKGDMFLPRYAFRLVSKDGGIKWVEINAVLVDWEGKPATLNFLSDITERKMAEEKIRETVGSLRNALGGIIQVLSSITEKRDPYTSGHQKRVADLARAIGQEMGLDAEKVEGLRLAGTIHDVGKVSIPAEILSKPGPLTKIEFEMIKSHPQVGHDIIQDIDFAQPIAEMILQHHERMNGSGYPNRLKGKKILLEARILAVSDVVEAMASHRPYRSALGTEVALEEIEKNKGVLYDPDVVSACLTLFRKKGFKLK